MKEIQMKNLSLFFVIIFVVCFGLNAQSLQERRAVTHFYVVNLDEDLYNVFTQAKHESSPGVENELIASILDTFYTIASVKFRNELGLELLPLTELKDKIKYNSRYPNCPDMSNIKKVLKSVAGYDYYADYYVNVFSDLNTDSQVQTPLSRIKPLYAISFTLYNATGKIVEKIDFSYKSRKTLAENSKVDVNKNGQQLKSKLCDLYSEALNGFYVICRKKLTASL
jgi:hypothetical protein